MDEEFRVSENPEYASEHYQYSEFNAETQVGETVLYASEAASSTPEFQTYGAAEQGTGGTGPRLSRHSSVLRNRRSRLGRLLAMLASVSGPAIVAILVLATSVFVDVSDYAYDDGSLRLEFDVYSSSDSTEFSAVLSDDGGNPVGRAAIDREDPVVTFGGLAPGRIYYLEVFADGESRLKLNYLIPLPEEEEQTEPGGDATGTDDSGGHGSGTHGPGTGTEAPGTETGTPGTEASVPGTGTEAPGTDTEEPGTDTEPPVTEPPETEPPETEPPVTEPPETEPPVTEPPVTEPPETEPPVTEPPETEPPVTEPPETEPPQTEPETTEEQTVPKTPATMSLVTSSNGLTTASAEFSVVNPDGNTITAKLDGSNYTGFTTSNGGKTIKVSLSGLAENSSHTLVFYDAEDGSQILSYPFSTRARTAATVTVGSISPGFRKLSLQLAITNPDSNSLELRLNGRTSSVSVASSGSQTVTLTGLEPRTQYTVSVYDRSVGKQVASASVTTATSVSWTQDGSGNATFTLSDAFASEYPGASMTLKDSLGQSVSVSAASGSAGFYAAADDIIYADTYTVTLMTQDGSVADTRSAQLSGQARPVFELAFVNHSPATLAEALSDANSHVSSRTYYALRYRFDSGYLPSNGFDWSDPDRKLFWNILIIKDASGSAVGYVINDLNDVSVNVPKTEFDDVYPQGMDSAETLPDGTYYAAFYRVDGYTNNEMGEIIWGGTTQSPASTAEIGARFMSEGRAVTADVTLTHPSPAAMAGGNVYFSQDPIANGTSTIYYLNVSYYPGSTGFEGFVTVVSASDTSTPLIDPISLGTSDVYGSSYDRLNVPTDGPVYIIVYQKSFAPENFLYVYYYPGQ